MFHGSDRPTLVFISAELSSNTTEANTRATAMLRRDLDNEKMNWTPVIGSYKGTMEQSNMIVVNPKQLDTLKNMAREFNQESILVRNSDGTAELHYINGSIELLKGRFEQITDGLYKYDSWTKIGDQYYTIK